MAEPERVVLRRSAVAALAGAWVQAWAQRPDQRLTWSDGAVWLGLVVGWWLQRAPKK